MTISNNKTVFIYSLSDKNGSIRYIGKTVNLDRRLKKHISLSKKTNRITKKVAWIRSLLKKGEEPIIEVIDTVDKEEWQFWEKFYISLFKQWGFKLTNGTDGGDGNDRWQDHHTEETKEKIRKAHLGRKFNDEHRLKLSISHIGNKNACGKRDGKARIEKRILQVDYDGRVVRVWDDAVSIKKEFVKKDNFPTSVIHDVCRSNGRKSYMNYYWIYMDKLKLNYSNGDIISEISFNHTSKKVNLYDSNMKYIRTFPSISSSGNYLLVSEATVRNRIKDGKIINNYFVRFGSNLGYRDVIYRKENLLKMEDNELNNVVDNIIDSFVVGNPFPYHKSKETLDYVLEKIRNYDFDKLYDRDTKTFNNITSSVGISYLKELFPHYYHCNYRSNLSPVEAWNNIDVMRRIVKYRVGLNKKRETFDISMSNIVRGMSANRMTISIFKPLVAFAIYRILLKDIEKPIVIDPCAGFGGRMLGFFAAYPNGTYIGIEPNKKIYNSLVRLSKNLDVGDRIKLFNCKAEDFDYSKYNYDMSFTSIPYYDLENYGEWYGYKNFDDWNDKFLKIFSSKIRNSYVNMSNEIYNKLVTNNNVTLGKEHYYIRSSSSHFSKKNTKREIIILF